jgi:hypothetical protein
LEVERDEAGELIGRFVPDAPVDDADGSGYRING